MSESMFSVSHLTGQRPQDGSPYKHSFGTQRQSFQHVCTRTHASVKKDLHLPLHGLHDLRQDFNLHKHRFWKTNNRKFLVYIENSTFVCGVLWHHVKSESWFFERRETPSLCLYRWFIKENCIVHDVIILMPFCYSYMHHIPMRKHHHCALGRTGSKKWLFRQERPTKPSLQHNITQQRIDTQTIQ